MNCPICGSEDYHEHTLARIYNARIYCSVVEDGGGLVHYEEHAWRKRLVGQSCSKCGRREWRA